MKLAMGAKIKIPKRTNRIFRRLGSHKRPLVNEPPGGRPLGGAAAKAGSLSRHITYYKYTATASIKDELFNSLRKLPFLGFAGCMRFAGRTPDRFQESLVPAESVDYVLPEVAGAGDRSRVGLGSAQDWQCCELF